VKNSLFVALQAKARMTVMHPLPRCASSENDLHRSQYLMSAEPSSLHFLLCHRLGEIATEVDADPRAAYFRYGSCASAWSCPARVLILSPALTSSVLTTPHRQMENGLYVRMALLQQMLLR
jgi:aspartate carbamoyltransferase catalytic subunit